MKVLNLYAGIGGNRKLWKDVDVTAIEYNQKIADIYKQFNPNDTVLVCDAHQFLLEHYSEFDFIWSSPPCQSHSKMIRSGKNRKPRYPDLKLYEEIIFLKCNFKGIWVVENVNPYYTPLILAKTVGRHLFWSNFNFICGDIKNNNFINKTNTAGSEELKKWLGLNYKGNLYYEDNHDPAQILRNCVHLKIGEIVFNGAIQQHNKKTNKEYKKQGLIF
jgi:DNA (cytosine-5)-methyltransferase 1